jgi:hypothetical protein
MDEGHAATLLDLLKSAEVPQINFDTYVQEDLPQDREVVDYSEQVAEPSEARYDGETEQTDMVSSLA